MKFKDFKLTIFVCISINTTAGSVINSAFSLSFFFSFQILYANEGEIKRDQEVVVEPTPFGDRPSYISHKGHEFIPTLYHFPSSCEACTRPLWHVFKPPSALECRRCHTKCHKDHLDRKEEVIVPCKGQFSHKKNKKQNLVLQLCYCIERDIFS